MCRFATLGRYPTWEVFLREWKEGICYSFGNKQTMPLEKDLHEGLQQKSTATSRSQKEPWRQGITDRIGKMDRNILIYGMLQAESDGKDLKQFMAGYVKNFLT